MYRREEKFIQDFGGKNLKEGDYLEELGVQRRKIIKWIIKKKAVGRGLESPDSG
jgi:hypothetical protein